MIGSHVPTGPNRNETMDAAHLRAAIHGDDPAAFRELYRRYLPHLRHGVRAFLYKCPRLRSQEEEIVSRAWVRLLARQRKLLRSFDPQRASFEYFMSMVGANTAWQVAMLKPSPSHAWGEAHEDQLVAALPSDASTEAIIADRELLTKLSEELQRVLSERELRLLTDVIVWQRPANEVAEELGIGVEAVWTATSRLRKKLEAIVATMIEPRRGALRLAGTTVSALLMTLAMASQGPIAP